jgi:NADPH-dependent ferric siderophore reductase
MPQRRQLPISSRVARVERLSASLVRVVVAGDELARFGPPAHADAYVKVVFLHPDVDYDRPIDLTTIRETRPAEQWPRLRTYTVREFDPGRNELTLDFVVHGSSGLAGPWAAAAQPGDEVLLLGPGGGYNPEPAADWHLIAGDESTLPAIAVALERIPADAEVTAYVEVDGPADEIDLARPVTWLHRGGGPVGSRLVDAVRAWSQPAGVGQAFVHGEAGMVKELRRHLRLDRQLPMAQLSISGYWRTGIDDEGWRQVKREWNREVEETENAAGVG